MMGGAHIARSTSYANIQLGLGAILGCKRPRVKFPQTQQELRAAIIEELNFLNWDFFFPGFPEKHAGIIIEGGADLPFPP